MLTVMYDDDMPTPAELDEFARSLIDGGSLDASDASRVARVLQEVANALRRPLLGDGISDEGFD